MTKEQAKVIMAFAENDMKVAPAAKQLHRSSENLSYHLDKIKNQIGWNPRNFFDLCYLVGVAAQRLGGKHESNSI